MKALDMNMLKVLPLCQVYCKHFTEFVIFFLNALCGIFLFFMKRFWYDLGLCLAASNKKATNS